MSREIRTSAKAVVIKDNKLLAIKLNDGNEEFYILPGGGQDSEGVIVAKRHIHLVPETAEKWGVKNKDVVSVKVDSDGRKAILGDVVIRVSENFADAMHIDTDESNAVMATPGMMVEVIK